MTTTTNADAFNGWSNRETWTINLWLTSNDSATYELALDIAKAGDSDGEAAARLDSYFGDIEIEGNGMAQDLINAALCRVDWLEIAKSLREI
jgi:hypothetical protein